MFNHFFFDESKGKDSFTKFVSACLPGELLIVIDPPFGGLVSVLAVTLKKINKAFCQGMLNVL